MRKTFVVGDIHGCLGTFERLLEEARFDVDRHRLWLVGDIVNRGPDSLGMLRRARQLHEEMGSRFRMVLGNHDLHLLAVADRASRQRPKDTFTEILTAPDRGGLLGWLRRRKLAHLQNGYLLVHAGILPTWTLDEIMVAARQLEKRLRKGNKSLSQRGASRSMAALTRIRMLDSRSRMSTYSGTPEEAPRTLKPWFKLWQRRHIPGEAPLTILFGHWAALGQRSGGKGPRHWISLDSGCVYGRDLSALRLPDGKLFTTPFRP